MTLSTYVPTPGPGTEQLVPEFPYRASYPSLPRLRENNHPLPHPTPVTPGGKRGGVNGVG